MSKYLRLLGVALLACGLSMGCGSNEAIPLEGGGEEVDQSEHEAGMSDMKENEAKPADEEPN